jgi:dihydroorotase
MNRKRAVNLIVDLVLHNAKAYVHGKLVDCSLSVDEGRIVKIGKEATMPKADSALDLRDLVVLPGLIDVHVHLRDEGKARKEDFYTGTAAAAAGGITTVLDMPNNDPVTMNVETLGNRMRIAETKILVNVGFFSEFPEDMEEIRRIMREGAIAFKLFMAEQVGGLNIDDDAALFEAFRNVSSMKTLVAAHAEDRAIIRETEEKLKRLKCNDVDAFLEAHSESAEDKAIKRLVKITKKAGSCLHFCHVSTKEGLRTIIEAKKSQMPVSCEVTPHHLFLSANELRTIGTTAVTMPPVR